MFESYFDPPEEPDLPPCPKCGSAQTDIIYKSESLICHDCGFKWILEPEPQLTPEDYGAGETVEDFQAAEEKFCRHRNAPEDCDACAYESDAAYDAQRERRGR